MKIEIKNNAGEQLALIIPNIGQYNNTEFFTDNKDQLQIGVIVKNKGENVKPHIHKLQHRKIDRTTEVLIVIKGELSAHFYDDDKLYISRHQLTPGDILVQFKGGHSFEMSADATLIEVKQGPYIDTADKEYF